jgi:hypothetical protein
LKPGSLEHHQQSAAVAALYAPDPTKVLAELLTGAEALHCLAERLAMTRNPAICDQIAAQAEGIRRAAQRARAALMTETAAVGRMGS